MREAFRQPDFQSEVCAFPRQTDNGRNKVNVALHEMSADATVSTQSALQIYRAALLQLIQVSASDCFLEKIEASAIVAARSQRQDSSHSRRCSRRG